MTAEAVKIAPFLLFSGLSLFIPVLVGIATRNAKAFRRSLLAGGFVIAAMLAGPHLVSIHDAPDAYLAAGILVGFFLALIFLKAMVPSDHIPAEFFALYGLPIALAAWLALAQIFANFSAADPPPAGLPDQVQSH